ncbi:hypothetical protein TWF970_006875 [Orbilia oligospora]|uniref:Uncharacterized protein n=1 Tax=Orbilia oligospora TaxID=2813651 RepID=A0A7C8R7T0_ORBOL|nr:hypothetical protein TWF970_006875 [Orbilia oligospora]
MKLSVVVLSAFVAMAYSYPTSNAKPDIHEITPSQIHLNDPKLSINQDKTSKPHPADTFSKMSNCGQLLTAKVAELDIVTVASEERVNKNEWVASYFCREV